jgi:hypothetical protein
MGAEADSRSVAGHLSRPRVDQGPCRRGRARVRPVQTRTSDILKHPRL